MAVDVFKLGPSATNLTAVATPTAISVQTSALDSSYTNRPADGVIVRTVVRGNANRVRKLSLEWELISESACSQIMQLMTDPFFYCYYRDPRSGAFRTAQFYAGDMETEVRRAKSDGSNVYASLSVSITER